ncbi:MAG: InlB B-repeat-containing protein [Lachnospiraceae bacterium]|nr:InlB B-repeat-containing protein [Lachnospiraceae bacterium]
MTAAAAYPYGAYMCYLNASALQVYGSGTSFSTRPALYLKSGITFELIADKYYPEGEPYPTFTVTYDPEGGSVMTTSQTKRFGSTYGKDADGSDEAMPTPERTGYSFDGWYTEDDGAGTQITDSTTVTAEGNHTLHAKWTARSYTVTFKYEDGTTADGSESVTYDTAYGTLPEPSWTNYTFGGWWTRSGGSGTQVTGTTTVTTASNHNLYAKWTADSYTIIYNLDSGINPDDAPTSYTYGIGATLPTPTKTGHTFGGWYTNPELSGSNETSISDTDTGSKDYYAKWTVNTYTITYNLNSGINPDDAPISYTYGIGATLPIPTKTGHTFGGWYTTTNFSGSAVTSIIGTDTGNKAYYAKWTANSYTIIYNLDSGINPDDAPTSYTYGVGATLPTPTKTGHTFGGWYTNPELSGSNETSISDTDIDNKTYYAKWTVDTYTITYNLNSGINPDHAPISYTYGIGATLPTPTKTGHTFGGWYITTNFSGSAVTSIIGTDTGNKTYYAKWTANSYTIAYNLNEGINPDDAPTSYTYGIGAILPTPAKTGYTFIGWYTTSGFSGFAVTSIGDTDIGNKIYYAKWRDAYVSDSPSRAITVIETSSDLFARSSSAVLVEANMDNAFSSSVEVRITDTDQEGANFGFGVGTDVYPFDISLYIEGTNIKTEPMSGYAVTISLRIPEDLLDVREQLFIVHKSDDGTVTNLTSSLEQINGIWYLIFGATEFSPYAFVVNNNKLVELPYYIDSDGNEVFIGLAANGKYLAPDGVTVMFASNSKNFTDISDHWGKSYIDFVTEREIFMGTGTNIFSPDAGMTRAMFATVMGRMYERSYGEIIISDARAFIDCNYDDYYGKYVNWAAENGIIHGVGSGLFKPDLQITHQELAAMIYRFAEFMKLSTSTSTGATLNYSDASSIASWAQPAVLYCQETGIITRRDDGSFAPTEIATRAEVAAAIQRFVELVLD